MNRASRLLGETRDVSDGFFFVRVFSLSFFFFFELPRGSERERDGDGRACFVEISFSYIFLIVEPRSLHSKSAAFA